MSNIEVSVIIPVYNVAKYIDDCVSSVCSQTMKNIEILLIDDGSTDNSAEVCRKWTEKDSRVRLIQQPNQGVSVARNRGIEESKGKWIAFIDSDDWIEPEYLQVLHDNAIKNSADVSICGFFFNYPDEQVSRGHYQTDMLFNGHEEVSRIQIQILAKNMCGIENNSGDRIGAPWCKLFSADFIRNNKLSFVPGLKRSQDVVFNLYALEKAEKICYVNVPAYHYRIIEESVCNKFSKQILTNVTSYLEEMDKFILTYHEQDRVFREAFYTKTCTSVYKCLFQYFFHEQYPGKFKEMKKELNQYLSQPVFEEALKSVKYEHLDKTEKVFVFCLKHNMIRTLNALVKLRQRFIKKVRH